MKKNLLAITLLLGFTSTTIANPTFLDLFNMGVTKITLNGTKIIQKENSVLCYGTSSSKDKGEWVQSITTSDIAAREKFKKGFLLSYTGACEDGLAIHK